MSAWAGTPFDGRPMVAIRASCSVCGLPRKVELPEGARFHDWVCPRCTLNGYRPLPPPEAV